MANADEVIYDFQEATAQRIAEIFRAATIDEAGNEKLSGGQRRVLLADEVGLGKTHVAARVISLVRNMRQEVNDKMFRVVYVCSNMNIANQNIQKLEIKNKADVSESRLSMQHLTIREREAEITDNDTELMGEIIIPLTPTTSFSLTGRPMGIANERALIAQILLRIEPFGKYKSEVHEFFRGASKPENWRYTLKRYDTRVSRLNTRTQGAYIADIADKLANNADFSRICRELIAYFEDNSKEIDTRRIINSLRRIFADISLSMLEPDLIIMDEFQRFSSLLDYNDESEQSAIVKKFFEQQGGQQPMILLLSATPYKPYSTLEELAEFNIDVHYKDFHRLMDFLFSGAKEFRTVWSDYSNNLTHLAGTDFDVLLASKQRAEDMMYEAICRTERLKEGLISDKAVEEIRIDENDILSYCEMQKIVNVCNEAAHSMPGQSFSRSNIPVEYVKSAPYLLSFMDNYKLKRQIEAVYEERGGTLPIPSARVLLRQQDLENFHKLPMRNARMEFLRNMMLGQGGSAAMLMWVPASRPYYTVNADNPFSKNKDFSKVLVFSAWEMVPRMISTLLTYEAERTVIFSKYKKARYKASTGENRIKGEAKNLLTFPSKYLAGLYKPEEYFGRPVREIRDIMRRRIGADLAGIGVSERRSYGKILAALKWLEDREQPKPEEIPANTISMLADMAIAAPGVCLYRLLANTDITDAETQALETANGFAKIFNRRLSGYIIDKLQDRLHSDELYLDGVMDYCVMGNLQAVLDEYAHMISPKGDGRTIAKQMKEAFIGSSTLSVDTDKSFAGKAAKFNMQVYYAMPFVQSKNGMDEKTVQHSNNVRTSFQSPFYPFVLASTSVGQEGLDFHWYCRKIVHWNLPSNPQDMEQREGRINRYKCLAIRRNLSKRDTQSKNWNELFERAREAVQTEFSGKYTDMVPNWCLPPEWLKSSEPGRQENQELPEWIERIVPQYPMSSDISRYRRLKEILFLYRLTLGQPRQEELLHLIEREHLPPDRIQSLLFNLSPIARD